MMYSRTNTIRFYSVVQDFVVNLMALVSRCLRSRAPSVVEWPNHIRQQQVWFLSKLILWLIIIYSPFVTYYLHVFVLFIKNCAPHF